MGKVELSIMLLDQIIAMVLMVFVGFLVARLGVITSEDSRALTRVSINVLVPCALVDGFQTDFETGKLLGMLVVCLSAAAIYGSFLLLGRLLKAKGFTPGERASVTYGNAGNLIMPLVQNTLGSGYMIYICAYLLVQNSLLWTHARSLMSGRKDSSLRSGLLNINMCSIYVGLALFLLRIRLPGPIGNGLRILGGMVGPVSMLVVGILLAGLDFKAALTSLKVYRIVALRLVGFPAVALCILWLVNQVWGGADSVNILTVALLCSSGPSATMITQLAQLYDSPERQYVSFINAVSTILCAATIPVVCGLFQIMAG